MTTRSIPSPEPSPLESAKLELKFLVADPASAPEPEALIPVLHRFIRERALPDLLIDVADYSHVREGPGVLLVAHEAHYGYGAFQGLGLLYSRRRETEAGGSEHRAAQRLRSVLLSALRACRLLEEDPVFADRAAGFDLSRWLLRVNDRLASSDSEAADAALALLERELAEIFASPVACRRLSAEESGGDSRFAVWVDVEEPPPLDRLLDHLEEPPHEAVGESG